MVHSRDHYVGAHRSCDIGAAEFQSGSAVRRVGDCQDFLPAPPTTDIVAVHLPRTILAQFRMEGD